MYPIVNSRNHTTDLYVTMRKSNELARNYFRNELDEVAMYCLADCIAIGYELLETSSLSNDSADLPDNVGPAYMQSRLLTSPTLLNLAEKLYIDSSNSKIKHNNIFRAIYLVATELKKEERIWKLLQMYPAPEFQYAIIGVFLFSYILGITSLPRSTS